MRKLFRQLVFVFIFFQHGLLLLSQEELLVKRQAVFEFSKEPSVAKKNDQFVIEFEVKSYCDVTVAIEDESGEIHRHLASGVLGSNPPAIFQANSLKQSIVWDGKNDRGEYLKSYDGVHVRVSLGLKPMFDKNLYHEPKRRQGREAPLLQARAEGVYVYDGGTGLDFVKLYSHSGEYIKTIYPFPGDKIKDVRGLNMHTFPDGQALPVKPTFLKQTFLTSGNDYGYEDRKKFKFDALISYFGEGDRGMEGNASSFLAVNNGKVALGMKYLFRFATDGSSGGMEVEGPRVALLAPSPQKGKMLAVAPRSGGLSPDGKTLYLTGYHYCNYGKAANDLITSGDWNTFNCVLKMDLEGDKDPELFVGSLELNKSGDDEKSLFIPTNVICDKAGRVYVSDYMNDRVQIFSPDGKFLKSLAVTSPSQVSIHEKTQEIYVFSSMIYTEGRRKGNPRKTPVKYALTIFSEFSKAEKKTEVKLPKEFSEFVAGNVYMGGLGFPVSATVAADDKETYIWLVKEWPRENVQNRGNIQNSNIKIYGINKGALVEKADFDKDVTDKNINVFPARNNRPRLYGNPHNQKVYLGESLGAYHGKAFSAVKEIDPVTGKVTHIELPFDTEDMAFDQRGYAYLRTLWRVVRYDISTTPWREVPWDYGVEDSKIYTDTGGFRREAKSVSAIALPGGGGWHHGGMYLNPKGHLAIGCISSREKTDNSSGFTPTVFPGRSLAGRGGVVAVHVYDQFGNVINKDYVPGLADNTYGLGLDNAGNLYMMASGTRYYDGKKYYWNESGTLMKFKPNKGKIVSRGSSNDIPLPLPKENHLKEAVSIGSPAYSGGAWVEGAEWFFGGVGFSGKNSGVGCSCWNARMTFDYFNRSFAPEIDRYSVAVVDEAGNLVLRVGQYGNADSQGAKSKAPLGGDEVGMMYGSYLGILSDKYLFIADAANQKIISVKLGYAKTQKMKLPQ